MDEHEEIRQAEEKGARAANLTVGGAFDKRLMELLAHANGYYPIIMRLSDKQTGTLTTYMSEVAMLNPDTGPDEFMPLLQGLVYGFQIGYDFALDNGQIKGDSRRRGEE